MKRPNIHLLVMLLVAIPATAQLTFVYPTNGQSGVERAPSITIRAPIPILRTSVSASYPDADVMGMLPQKPTIMVVDTALDGVPISEQIARAANGTYSFPDPRTVSFTPHHLVPGHTYRVTVDGLWVEAASPTALPAATMTFTVAEPTPTIRSCSIEGIAQLSCSDTIAVNLTAALAGGLGDAMRVIQLERASNGMQAEWRPESPVLALDGTRILITPTTPWQPGDQVRLHVLLGAITGNELDNAVYSTVVRRATTVRFLAEATDGRSVPEDIQARFESMSHVCLLGSSLPLVAQEHYQDRWRFVRWESETLPAENGTSRFLDLPCDGSTDEVVVRAVLEQLDTVKLYVHADSTGSVLVFNADNELVRTITDEDSLLFTSSFSSACLVAVPTVGYSFSSWQAAGTTLHNSTTAAVSIPPPIVFQLALLPTTGSLWPKFNPNSPSTEVYGISGSVLDMDNNPLWSASEAVRFTTEKQFGGTLPEEKTLCIEVDDCWEIIGYSSSGRGTNELYDTPVQQACVTDYMMNPENKITFFVQRKYIYLRVEQVLMSSESPTNLLPPDQMSSATKIVVDVKTKDGSRTVWSRLSEVPCFTGNVRHASYKMQCGDQVRLSPKSDGVRGQSFRYFDVLPEYVLPNAEDPTAGEMVYQLVTALPLANFEATSCSGRVLDEPEIRVRANFKQSFGIEAIGLSVRVTKNGKRQGSKFVDRWFDPLTYRVVGDDEPLGGRQVEYVPREGALVKIRFNMPVDQTSIQGGGIYIDSYDNTLYSDPDETNLDFVTTTSYFNTSFEGPIGYAPNTVVISVKNPNSTPILQALHGGTFKLITSPLIKSLSGTPCESTTSFLIQSMELPAYSLQLHDVEFEFDGDADFIWDNDGEIYHAIFGGDFGQDAAHELDQGFKRIPDCSEQQGVPPGECTLKHSDKDGPQGYGDMLLWIQPDWMDRGDVAYWHAATYDEDCKDEGDCFVNRVQDLLDVAKKKAKELAQQKNNSSMFTELSELGIDFVRALLPADDQDEHLGYGTFIASAKDFWGCRRSTTYVEIGDENTTYRLLPSLLVTRGVVR